MTSPLVCTLTEGDTNGGIARVSELLWRASKAMTGGLCRRLSLFSTEGSALTFARRIGFARALVGAQLSERPPWILFDHLAIARPQALVPAAWRAPYTVFLHGIEVWRPLPQHRKRPLLQAEFLIANSQFTADHAKAFHPDLPPIHVCHLALDERPIPTNDLDRELIGKISARSVLLVARMSSGERYKGHDELLESWPQVLARVPDAQLVIAGRGDDLSRYRGKAQALGIDSRVLFTGGVSEATLHALYDRAAIYAMPARSEGFGLVYLEAMSHRLPVLASPLDAASEVIAEGETGFLVNPNDRHAIADRLIQLLADESLRQRLGDAGYTRWRTRFSYQQFASRLEEILGPLRARPV